MGQIMKSTFYKKLASRLKILNGWMIFYSFPATIFQLMKDVTVKQQIICFCVFMFFCVLYMAVREYFYDNTVKKNTDDVLSMGMFAIYIPSFVISYAYKMPKYYIVLLVYFIITLILYLLNGYFSNYANELKKLKNREANDYIRASKDQHILYFKYLFIVFFLCFALVFIPQSRKVQESASHIKDIIQDADEEPVYNTGPGPHEIRGKGNENYHDYDPIPILIVSNVIIIAIFAWIIISALRERKNRKKPVIDVGNGKVFITEEIVQEEKGSEKDKRPGIFDNSPAARIRKCFIKSGLKLNAGGIRKSDTPSEIIKEKSLMSPENTLRTLYEKARYSELECTKDDAAEAKKCMVILRKNS